MIIIVLYAVAIIASLIMMHVSRIMKKEDYLSIAFDFSIVLLLYFWDKQHIAIFIASLVALLAAFFIILYFEIIKPSENTNYLKQLISQEKENLWAKGIKFLCVIMPICFNSTPVMLIILIIYLIVNRMAFYKKFESIV